MEELMKQVLTAVLSLQNTVTSIQKDVAEVKQTQVQMQAELAEVKRIQARMEHELNCKIDLLYDGWKSHDEKSSAYLANLIS